MDEEEGLVVTYCKRGTVMPHARHDCTEHPFEYGQGWAIPFGLPFPTFSFLPAGSSSRAVIFLNNFLLFNLAGE